MIDVAKYDELDARLRHIDATNNLARPDRWPALPACDEGVAQLLRRTSILRACRNVPLLASEAASTVFRLARDLGEQTRAPMEPTPLEVLRDLESDPTP